MKSFTKPEAEVIKLNEYDILEVSDTTPPTTEEYELPILKP